MTHNTSETGMKGVLSLYGNTRRRQVKVTPPAAGRLSRPTVFRAETSFLFYLVSEDAGPGVQEDRQVGTEPADRFDMSNQINQKVDTQVDGDNEVKKRDRQEVTSW